MYWKSKWHKSGRENLMEKTRSYWYLILPCWYLGKAFKNSLSAGLSALHNIQTVCRWPVLAISSVRLIRSVRPVGLVTLLPGCASSAGGLLWHACSETTMSVPQMRFGDLQLQCALARAISQHVLEYSTCWKHKNTNMLRPGGWLEPSNYICSAVAWEKWWMCYLSLIKTSLPAFSPRSGLLSTPGRTEFCHCGWDRAGAAPVKGMGGEQGRGGTNWVRFPGSFRRCPLPIWRLAHLGMECLAVALGAFFHKVPITVVFFPRSLSIPRSCQRNRYGVVGLGFSGVN